MQVESEPLNIEVPGSGSVSALLDRPAEPQAAYVFAHGAGAGMTHAFMASVAAGLATRGVAVLRFQFPFVEHGSKRPDPPAVAQATVRAAVGCAATRFPGLPLFAGGKSFGGRMTSQAQAAAALPGVVGLVFVGFPLHSAGKPSVARAAHLDAVAVPMLFAQGDRDALAELPLLAPMVSALGARATLHRLPDADHAFHVRRSSGTTDEATLTDLLDTTNRWMREIATAVGSATAINN